ncbi:MAG: primosomal protein N' [Phycisphaerales bacterium]|nr:primosomal protein N' [Phycisphaerales bacterium]
MELFAQEISGWVEVAVDAAFDPGGSGGLHYALDSTLTDLAPGDPVTVPLGKRNRPVRGWVVDRLDSAPPMDATRVKHVLSRIEDAPVLPASLIDLARWIAGYYITPLGTTLASMQPPKTTSTGAPRQHRWIDLATTPPETGGRLGANQAAILEYLRSLPASNRPVERLALVRSLDLNDASGIDRLVTRGLLQEVAAPVPEGVSPIAPSLTDDQRQVIDAIDATAGGFSVHMLLGVTGSGKTEVYLQLIERTLHRGHAALVLVPEILLTPQTAARLESRFPDRGIGVLHSGVSVARRRNTWRRVREGEIDIVLGARSAVFAPFSDERLGLIVVDESHDSSYKQDTAPRYHGRDVAMRRGQQSNCPVVLGSATPSMESWFNATVTHKYTLHRLNNRAPGLTRPKVRIVDRIEERKADPGPQRSLGPTLRRALTNTLLDGGQALLLLNRRGWATHIACRSRTCGWVMRCDQCDAALVFHRKRDIAAGGTLQCHHCLSQLRMPRTCPACAGGLSRLGEGSQRLEDEIALLHPDLVQGEQLVRLDVDTRGSGERVRSTMNALRSGQIRVLVGTQMIAKGLDLPGVHLVGVVDADTALHQPDFRAAERTFQLVAQVAGRCGRGDTAGTVIIQTCCADDPAIALAAAERYEAFATLELEQRQLSGLPPVRRMARMVVDDPALPKARDAARALAQRLRAVDVQWAVSPPAPCPLARAANRFRWQVDVMADTPAILHQGLVAARASRAFDALGSIMIDVDPLYLQ